MAPRSENEEVADKAAKTRIHNLTVEKNQAWRTRDEARRVNPEFITKAQLNSLRKVFHPDIEAGVSQERKAELNAAAAIFNGLKFKIVDKD